MTSRRRKSSRPNGFTLIESLMAAGVLLIIVTAVGLAVSSGQQHGYWSQLRIAGTLAADELMCRLQAVDYDDLATDWDGYREEAGLMVDVNGDLYPSSFADVGRSVTVSSEVRLRPTGSAEVFGRNVTVTTFDGNGRTLAELNRFVPEPVGNEDAMAIADAED